ncbi:MULTISPECIES: GNAT family N-acetyltransferase [unclassified Duganella]|uniref:GNAT family N-acetyltransferase n=1 Tax=unclassified Duganella TaxID=2636909 RepID=UPI0006F3A1C1|nr:MULTISPECIES: GNAT family N-acetyltransferase [unclassified Duganella]KQV59665.1 hypothetical protein ASD07_22820 [Duganella sp. Root336D2]
MKITLRAVTRENLDEVADLRLLEHQQAYLASNSYSIAEASFNPALRPRSIYADERLVGFLMYLVPEECEDPPGEYGIWRFMVDASVQGRGYGRQAFALLMAEIRSDANARRIFISYKPENLKARDFYASFGFEETGIEAETGEMVAVVAAAQCSLAKLDSTCPAQRSSEPLPAAAELQPCMEK